WDVFIDGNIVRTSATNVKHRGGRCGMVACRNGPGFNGGGIMPQYTAIVTLLAVAFYFFLATRVAAARGRFGVKHPATTGNPDFERIFRVHLNTLEWLPTFLAPLRLCALYLSDVTAALLGF